MAQPTEPAETLLALAGIGGAEQSLETMLLQVLDLACEALEGGDLGGVTPSSVRGRSPPWRPMRQLAGWTPSSTSWDQSHALMPTASRW